MKATVYGKFCHNLDLQTSEEKAKSKIVLASMKWLQVDPRVRKNKPLTQKSYPSQEKAPDVNDMLECFSTSTSLKALASGPAGATDGEQNTVKSGRN